MNHHELVRIDSRAHTRRKALAYATLLTTLASCHLHGGVYAGVEPEPVTVVLENEPNDEAGHANELGWILPGDTFVVEGELHPGDPYDGFAFRTLQPLSIEATLDAHGFLDDFDLCVYEPLLDEFTLCFESPFNPEQGIFDVLDPGAEFHLVVLPFSGTGRYTLRIEALPLPPSSYATAGGAALSGTSQPALATRLPIAQEREPARLDAYRQARPGVSTAPGPRLEAVLTVIDLATGEVSSAAVLRR